MRKTTQSLLIVVAFLFTTVIMAQSNLKGKILETGTNMPLPGANVVEKGTTNGTSTDFEGNFMLETESNSGQLVISYVGYETLTISFNGNADLGSITLTSDNSLEEIVITAGGVIDLAEDRKTPVAVSTIKSNEIREKAANWDLPELLKSTPSVQNIKAGGFGDGAMYLRGFDQTNTAFLLNGQPINGMEDGKMYWSNWSGVLDVANAVQVQRGLGASKLAISSVGGTVNVVTKTIDNKKGGFIQQMVANDNYTKTTAYYSTGVNEKGWSFAAMLGHWQGDGYVNYTDGQGQTYFLSVGYKPSDSHVLNFLVTGAPQWHAAAGSGSIGDFLENGRRYNSWNFSGVNSPNTLHGGNNVYPGGRNIYHKPVANLSWDWTINDKSSLSTVLYGSMGRGSFAQARTSGDEVTYARGSNNNHNWYGLVSNYNNQLSENFNLNLGADMRFYNGIHFRDVREFITVSSVSASSGYSGSYELTEAGGINPWSVFFNPNTDHGQRFGYDYEEQINYAGIFGQLEYANDAFSAFFQGALSTQSHVRTEFLNVSQLGQSEESEKVNNPGYNMKVGAAYEIAENHKLFANAGYYSRQPFHDVLFRNNRGSNELLKPEVENEKITGLEAGYQLGGYGFSANLNVYHTTWDNRTLLSDNGQQDAAYVGFQTQGVKQVHMGIELEVFTRPFDNLRLNGFLSLGDWKFVGNASQRSFNQDGNEIGTAVEVEIDGFNVGGAAQVTGGINADYMILPRFSVDGAWNWYNDMYSTGSLTQPTIAMPSYDTFDAGISYKMLLGTDSRQSLQLRFNLNNVFDEVYLESVDGNLAASSDSSQNYKGVNINNTGRFGYGRTWNFSLRYNF
ncbi:TonB-dependent receptor [Flavobacteriaceae bacterium XHP0103]|uniref:TonB-dependent receptor n=1 Tax=Marixanthotalea marina TaxID=2844359 RepID=UPI002989B4BA|nr:TonB-dependent receptor [Marixanthotalea marina]MBU3820835.1 TonB-dependent receptor [Marixanthotalea marina]